MKVTIAYTGDEVQRAAAVMAATQAIIGPCKVNQSDRHAPFLHLYLSSRKPCKPHSDAPNP